MYLHKIYLPQRLAWYHKNFQQEKLHHIQRIQVTQCTLNEIYIRQATMSQSFHEGIYNLVIISVGIMQRSHQINTGSAQFLKENTTTFFLCLSYHLSLCLLIYETWPHVVKADLQQLILLIPYCKCVPPYLAAHQFLDVVIEIQTFVGQKIVCPSVNIDLLSYSFATLSL